MIDYAAWLESSAAIRIILVEVNVKSAGSETTRYLASEAYTTSPTDSPANQYYEPAVTDGLQIKESLDLDGTGSMSAGDVEIANYNGVRDSWLDDIWDNRSIKVWIGDPAWARADFMMIFNGTVATIGSKSADILNLSIRDKLNRLNTPLTDKKIGGSDSNSEDVINLSFGEVSNVTPQSTNSGQLEFQVHDGPIEAVLEVRDNGTPVTANVDVTTGRFKLTRTPAGTITASVQGDKPAGTYQNTIANVVKRLATSYGTDVFSASEIDTDNFTAFNTANPQPIGIYAEGRTTVLDTCQALVSSLDARLVVSRLGQLRIVQVKQGGDGTPVLVDATCMVDGSLKITDRPFVKASVVLGFDKNWTVQEGLLTALPQEHKNLFASEWLTTVATSDTIKNDYKLNAAPEQEDTMLCRRIDARTEANRRLTLWKTPRTVFQFEGTPKLLTQLQLGSAVTLQHKRFGLQNGKPGVVTSLSPNWFTGHIVVEVLV